MCHGPHIKSRRATCGPRAQVEYGRFGQTLFISVYTLHVYSESMLQNCVFYDSIYPARIFRIHASKLRVL